MSNVPLLSEDEKIVCRANALAREFYGMLGCQVAEGYSFDRAKHPQEVACWRMACRAYEVINGTDVEDALNRLED